MTRKFEYWIPKINGILFKIGVIIVALNFLGSSIFSNYLEFSSNLMTGNLLSNKVHWSYEDLNIRYFTVRSQDVLGIDQNMASFLDTKKLEVISGPLNTNFIENFNISSFSDTMIQVQLEKNTTVSSNCILERDIYYSCLSQSFMAIPEKIDSCQCFETSYRPESNSSTLIINDQYISIQVNHVYYSRKGLEISASGTFDSIKTTFFNLNVFALIKENNFSYLYDVNYKDIFLTLFIIYKGYKTVKHFVFMAYAYILKKVIPSQNKSMPNNSNSCTFCEIELQPSTVVRLSNSLHSCLNCYKKKVIPIAFSLFLIIVIYEIVYIIRGYQQMELIFNEKDTDLGDTNLKPVLELLLVFYYQNPFFFPFTLWLCLYGIFGLIVLIFYIKERKVIRARKKDKGYYELDPLNHAM